MRTTRSITRWTEIALSEQFLEAWLREDASTPDKTLEVDVSDFIEEQDPLFAPVREYLAGQCFRDIIRESVEDETWVSEKIRIVFKVFDSCPGEGIDHDCLYERTGVVRMENGWLNIGQ